MVEGQFHFKPDTQRLVLSTKPFLRNICGERGKAGGGNDENIGHWNSDCWNPAHSCQKLQAQQACLRNQNEEIEEP